MQPTSRERALSTLLAFAALALIATSLASRSWMIDTTDEHHVSMRFGPRAFVGCGEGICSDLELDSIAEYGQVDAFRSWRTISKIVLVLGVAATVLLVATHVGVRRKPGYTVLPTVTAVAFLIAMAASCYWVLDPPASFVGTIGPAFPIFLAGCLGGVISAGLLREPGPASLANV